MSQGSGGHPEGICPVPALAEPIAMTVVGHVVCIEWSVVCECERRRMATDMWLITPASERPRRQIRRVIYAC